MSQDWVKDAVSYTPETAKMELFGMLEWYRTCGENKNVDHVDWNIKKKEILRFVSVNKLILVPNAKFILNIFSCLNLRSSNRVLFKYREKTWSLYSDILYILLPENKDSWIDKTVWNVTDRTSAVLNSSDLSLNEQSESRHSVTNETTKYLDELEIVFADNKKELDKIKNIVVIDNNHIKIGGFVHKLWTCSAEENAEKWIYNNSWNTLFIHTAAMDFALTQVGYRPYTIEEMEVLMISIPWKTSNDYPEIISKLLKIPFAGYCVPGGDVGPVHSEVSVWSSSNTWDYAHSCRVDYWLNRVSFDFDSIDFAFSLILHKV